MQTSRESVSPAIAGGGGDPFVNKRPNLIGNPEGQASNKLLNFCEKNSHMAATENPGGDEVRMKMKLLNSENPSANSKTVTGKISIEF